MMTREEKRDWLDRYRDRMCKAKLLEEELREARAAALPGSPGLDGMLQGQGGGSVVERAVLSTDGLEQEIREALAEAATVRAEILALIDKLPPIEYDIVRARHLDPRCPWRKMLWGDVARAASLSEERAQYLYFEILDRLPISSIKTDGTWDGSSSVNVN